jgi:hypothetical protein
METEVEVEVEVGEAQPAPAPVNSESYWSGRFAGDWRANDGPAQSRFFYRLAVDHLPAWLVRMLRAERPSVCDWGCATGDGTDVLAQAYSLPVTGIDFSRTAIEVASQSYPGLSFKCVDLLTETIEERFDVLFCSNTLEHFPDPWSVLAKVAGVAEQALIVLIPFREFERHSEHEVTFDSGTVPIVAAGDFQLVYARVVNTAKLTPTYWPGEQLLLVYAKPSLIERCALRLDDIVIDTGVLAKERARVQAVRRRLRAEIADRERVAHEVGRDTAVVVDQLQRARALAERNLHAVKTVTQRLAAGMSGDDETT